MGSARTGSKLRKQTAPEGLVHELSYMRKPDCDTVSAHFDIS